MENKEITKAIKEFINSSDVDEAAVEWICNHKDGDVLFVKDAFKAGAEWMVGQGASYEDTIQYSADGDVLYLDKTAEQHLSLEDKFKDGDKVIIQIRKV